MNISPLNGVNFGGFWKSNTRVIDAPKDIRADYAVLETKTYHPFKDESVPSAIKAMQGTKATYYFEYDPDDDDFGNEDVTIVVEKTEIGNRLDITEGTYNELLAMKEKGEFAENYIKTLGSKTPSSYAKKASNSGYAVKELSNVSPETLEKVLSLFNAQA